ncbi:MAG: site-2 protease family protein [Deltaproteobacteria bacterium]|nr:site-2 protease family protein [Deltaproteobacteria bacterium]
MADTGYPAHGVIHRPKKLLPAVLFAATVITTVIAGALYTGADILTNPYDITRGIPFSAALLVILGTHEMGHYIASRRHGVATTLPVFIPGPPLPPMIGTFGAVIKLKSPIMTRDALVDIGAAGPLAGFAVALAATVIGLEYSTIIPAPHMEDTLALGNSLIFRLLTYAVVGPVPEGKEVMLHPVAFAGWIGFFVTAMNLLPIGQLDGGHIVYAIVGRRHKIFSIAMVGVLVILGILAWPGWLVWALLITIVGMWHPPVQDRQTPMDRRRKVICALSLLAFILTFMPTPFYII